MPHLPHTISGVIQAFEDNVVLITLENNETIRLPKRLTSASAGVGSSVHIALFSDSDLASEHERLAKAVLSELLRRE